MIQLMASKISFCIHHLSTIYICVIYFRKMFIKTFINILNVFIYDIIGVCIYIYIYICCMYFSLIFLYIYINKNQLLVWMPLIV